ncbi:cobalt ABC transporter ATP-binding protein [Arthrobacter sp. MYb227]|uniref:energy-coupling factor ABC transporter ATP-binding protein n=1 Tax=Arthrobacter sp. MYb227 TaxID=1848601 RepID=UPI000CFBA3D7|nr:ABC transporter ATP-binding protein [Arthrobacter sp. MYb227]PQZ93559.1 cobalt ABC transporter ATP-binding protein [Arthrobacter sp. MYb227]
MIHFDNAGFSVQADEPQAPAHVVLAPTSLELSESRIAVIGANGSGKSTLLRMINGLVAPSNGSVRVRGDDTKTKIKAVRQNVGFLFTDPLSQLVMPIVVEDVELSLKASIKDRTQRRLAALSALAKLNLEHLAMRSIYDLSGGERQLVALCSVLAAGQNILVADEPTTLLDLANNQLLQHTIAALPQQVIYATHDLEFAAQAERGLLVANGQVIFDGPAALAVNEYRAQVRSGAIRA